MSDTLNGLSINEATVNDSGLSSVVMSVADGMANPIELSLAESGVGETYYVSKLPELFVVAAPGSPGYV